MFENVKAKFAERRLDNAQEKHARKYDVLYKRTGGEKGLFIVMLIIFVLFAASFIFPFLWVLMNSFKPKGEFAMNFMGLPKTWTFENYRQAFTIKESQSGYTVFQMLGMSTIIAGGGTLATVLTSSAAAYVVAKYKFPGRNLIFTVVIFAMIIPVVGALPSQIQLMTKLGLNGKILGPIFIYSGGFGANFLLLYSFFKNLSWTYVEAAKVDGASDFRIFFKIIVPMAKGPIIAVSVIQLIGLWNDYLTPSIYLPKRPTIAVGLKYISDALIDARGEYTVLFATIVLTLLPIIILFVSFSKTIMENTSVGGIKG